MKRIQLIVLSPGLSVMAANAQTQPLNPPPIAAGPFKPDWNSLTNYKCPEWFRDAKFPFAGVPDHGKLTKADGKGKCWADLDPQDLYAQNHKPGKRLVWDWDPSQGSSVPDAACMEKYFKRVKQLWDELPQQLTSQIAFALKIQA